MNTPDSPRSSAKWLLLLFGLVVLFYSKLIFTNQFSFLTGYEGTNQAYSWDNFLISSLKQGVLPLWDPYTHSGRDFLGEMQTAALYPLKVLLLLAPTDSRGMMAFSAEHYFFVFTHFLAAFFMFLLARRLGLDHFSALVAGLCFSLGGFMSRINWPDMLNSAIWLPLAVLCVDTALFAKEGVRAALFSCLAGLAAGMAILGGRIHIVVMDVLVIASMCAWWWLAGERAATASQQPRAPAKRALMVVCVVGVMTLCAGAAQLLPSMAYSRNALRYVGDASPVPGSAKIPYFLLADGLSPRALFALIFGFPFSATNLGPGVEVFSPYFGVLPLLLVIIGVWKNRDKAWVRYLAGLAVAAFIYSLGRFTLLHGLGYALVPYLWLSRIPVRFIYLTHFSMALLAGFGVHSLLSGAAQDVLRRMLPVLRWIVAGLGVVLVASVIGLQINEWEFVSFALILAGVLFLSRLSRGSLHTAGARVLVVALILCDLGAFDWNMSNKDRERQAGRYHLQHLVDSQNVVRFLRRQPGRFRVDIGDWQPNLGDGYQIETTGGMSATKSRDYTEFLGPAPLSRDLLNVRYILRPRSEGGAGAIYEDTEWQVYENPNAFPRAWLVHDVRTVASNAEALRAVFSTDVDLHNTAILTRSTSVPLGTAADRSAESVSIARYLPTRMELRVRALAPAVLVLSELYADGWEATANGRPVLVRRANGVFRALEVPAGESIVLLRYRPRPFLAGAALSVLAFLGTLLFALFAWKAERRERRGRNAASV